MSKAVKILSFESSCDDTSVAVLEGHEGQEIPKLLSLAVQSQFDVHAQYGGVVPELASRQHLSNIIPCLEKALREADVQLDEIDFFAATSRPGLVGSLLIGHSAAKTLAFCFGKKFIGCDHLEGHLMSVFLENKCDFPCLMLIASGGHTSLYLVKNFDSFDLLGMTLDDAAGEAFDKGAKLLGLGFPGGPELERLAQSGRDDRFEFPKVKLDNYRFSFSGLKSELVRQVHRGNAVEDRASLARAYQEAILNQIVDQAKAALEDLNIRQMAVVGGVARNLELKKKFEQLKEIGLLENLYMPSPTLCTDNAAMIGVVAYRKFLRAEFSTLEEDVVSTQRPVRQKRK